MRLEKKLREISTLKKRRAASEVEVFLSIDCPLHAPNAKREHNTKVLAASMLTKSHLSCLKLLLCPNQRHAHEFVGAQELADMVRAMFLSKGKIPNNQSTKLEEVAERTELPSAELRQLLSRRPHVKDHRRTCDGVAQETGSWREPREVADGKDPEER
eukprot:2040566-Amphidinium_carterae.2